MTTLTNSEGKLLTYTNEFIGAVLLQLNSSNNYYTSGDDDILFIRIGSNKVLVLYYIYHKHRNIFQIIQKREFIKQLWFIIYLKNNTSNEYDLQSVYNGNGFLGIITELSQVYLTMYDTTVSPYTYTGSENIDITDHHISLTYPLKINGEVVLNPRAYDGAVFEIISGIDSFYFSTKLNSRFSPNSTILFTNESMYI